MAINNGKSYYSFFLIFSVKLHYKLWFLLIILTINTPTEVCMCIVPLASWINVWGEIFKEAIADDHDNVQNRSCKN